jgi:hypothetical protein
MEFLFSTKELGSLIATHFQNLCNVPVAISHFEDFGTKTLASAFGALQLHIGHELHIHKRKPQALANLASTLTGIKTEVPVAESSDFGRWSRSKDAPNFIQDFQKGRRTGANRFSDRGLVDRDHLPDRFVPSE